MQMHAAQGLKPRPFWAEPENWPESLALPTCSVCLAERRSILFRHISSCLFFFFLATLVPNLKMFISSFLPISLCIRSIHDPFQPLSLHIHPSL